MRTYTVRLTEAEMDSLINSVELRVFENGVHSDDIRDAFWKALARKLRDAEPDGKEEE